MGSDAPAKSIVYSKVYICVLFQGCRKVWNSGGDSKAGQKSGGADQSTLFQPVYAQQITTGPPFFFNFRHAYQSSSNLTSKVRISKTYLIIPNLFNFPIMLKTVIIQNYFNFGWCRYVGQGSSGMYLSWFEFCLGERNKKDLKKKKFWLVSHRKQVGSGIRLKRLDIKAN